jgi:4'-phosphopantetheinyl transferase
LLALGAREVHVWFARSDEVADPAAATACDVLLSDDERARHRRLLRGGEEYRAAHALLRSSLSRYVDVNPRSWTFVATSHGRPEIAAPAATGLRFSLSHTPGLVACAVTRSREVGVDVEDARRTDVGAGVAERFFAPAEVATLDALTPAARASRFFELWTLKESYVKARGLGLSLPLDGFAFRVEPPSTVRVAFAPAVRDDARAWQFALFRPTTRHVLALAVRTGAGPPCAIGVRHARPAG